VCLAASALAACGNTTFKVEHVTGSAREGLRVSTFGVKRDGLMSHSGWQALGPEQPPPFGGRNCDVAFREELFTNLPDLASALDSYVREHDVTEGLLKQIAPAAQGDAILFFSMAGRPRASGSRTSQESQPITSRSGRGRRGGGGRAGAASQTSSNDDPQADALQISALLYSVRDHQAAALVEMTYTGTSMEDALREFNQRMDTEFPHGHCAGWDWSKPIDPVAIRSLPEE
jgi:hypothetical protein